MRLIIEPVDDPRAGWEEAALEQARDHRRHGLQPEFLCQHTLPVIEQLPVMQLHELLRIATVEDDLGPAVVQHKPRLLGDNGSCYITGDLAEWMGQQKMEHVRGAPFHPQTRCRASLVAVRAYAWCLQNP